MVDLYYWPTPNGHKVTLFLGEAELDYAIHAVNISAGGQFKPELMAFVERPATTRAYAKGEPYSAQSGVTEEGTKLLFGQTAANVVKV